MDIGNKSDTLILNTSGRVYIAVKDGKYELDFRGNNLKNIKNNISNLSNAEKLSADRILDIKKVLDKLIEDYKKLTNPSFEPEWQEDL